MPIREWRERVTIECSDAELPRAIAAYTGSYKPDVYITHNHSTENRLQITHMEEAQHIGVRVYDKDYA
jgi:hypothetical protein